MRRFLFCAAPAALRTMPPLLAATLLTGCATPFFASYAWGEPVRGARFERGQRLVPAAEGTRP